MRLRAGQNAPTLTLPNSTGQPISLTDFAQACDFRAGITFPLLADPDHAVLTAYGAWGEKKLYGKTVVGVIRSTFVIATNGMIEESRYGVKATGHVAKLIRELDIPSTSH